MPYEHHLQPNEDVLPHRNTSKQVPGNDPQYSASPRSLQQPEQQVVDWIKSSPFHISCVRRCVDKSTPIALHPNQPCFSPPLQGCTQPKPRVPTPFDPLSSFTGSGNWTPSGFRHTLVKKKKPPCPNTSHFCVHWSNHYHFLYRYNGTHRIGSSIVLFV